MRTLRRRMAATLLTATVAAMALGPLPASAAISSGPDPILNSEAFVGQTLTADIGPYTFYGCGGGKGPDFTVYWTRDGFLVAGETARSYALQPDDTGARMAVHVTASKTACGGESLHSDESKPVGAANRAAGFTGRSFELLARANDGALQLYGRKGNAWEAARTVGWGWNIFNTVLSPGDFNGDGKGDVIARDAAGTLYLYAGDGTGGWKPAQTIGKGWNIFDSIVSPGDFNGDGHNDILAREPNGALYLYPGNGSGGWLARTAVGQGWQVMDALLTPGDFNGDGKVDVLARDRSGYLYFYGGNGAGGWTRSWLIGVGWNALKAAGGAGDFDNDGFNDVYGVDQQGRLVIYYGNGRTGWRGSEVAGNGWGGFTAIF
ncbi:VCBS repeat-containing protein [Paenarthrobacter nitroguajacolicus]|uniref:VCBS repeat-containing protein n=1 Tax=Paenarthrobacter nitroguajacolicus TaxID=211146 RepID=A0A558GPV2_PAENT|nr:VCBS repeat-containing protein [Paenarthrobacter nitroguajacolicus]TVU58912.1 VCBS repeat-containing protein [Paenarthrobacter nitroguajacolicus]